MPKFEISYFLISDKSGVMIDMTINQDGFSSLSSAILTI